MAGYMRVNLELGISSGWAYEGETWTWVRSLAGHMRVNLELGIFYGWAYGM